MDRALELIETRMAEVEADLAQVVLAKWEQDGGAPEWATKWAAEWEDLRDARERLVFAEDAA